MKEPLEYYKSKLCRNKVYIKRTEQRSSMFFCGKLIFFAIAILCLCIWWFETKSVIMIGSTFCFLLIYFFMVYLDNNEINKKEKLVRINIRLQRGKYVILEVNILDMTAKSTCQVHILLHMTLTYLARTHCIKVLIEL